MRSTVSWRSCTLTTVITDPSAAQPEVQQYNMIINNLFAGGARRGLLLKVNGTKDSKASGANLQSN